MSSVDPLAVLAAQLAATQSGAPDASLDLGDVSQILQAQLAAGDILEATILPAQGGQDLISILGQTVVAQLPTDVHPGDVLLLQVTGFQGNQILVRNLGVQDPNNPVATFIPDLPASAEGSTVAATLTTIVGEPAAAPPPVASPQNPVAVEIPPSVSPPIAPPASVFVAASVRPSPAAQGPVAAPPLPLLPESTAPAVQQPPQVQAAQTQSEAVQSPPPQRAPAAGSPPLVDVEARLAATRAANTDRPAPQTPAQNAPSRTTPAAVPQNAPPPAAAQARSINLPAAPPIITRSVAAQAQPIAPQAVAQAAQQSAARTAQTVAQPTAQPTAQPAAQPVAGAIPQAAETPLRPAHVGVAAASVEQRAPARAANVAAQLADAVASREPVRILAALHVPATPVTLAAARVVTNAAVTVQTALQNLEQVLSGIKSSDARITTLQTLATFISRFEPRNAQTLSAQLSAFIGNVAGGAENKVSQLLQALAPPATPTDPRVQNTAPAHTAIVAEARAVERQGALSGDLKTTLLSLAADPPAGASAQLAQAVNDSLVAVTAMQFNTLIASHQDPNTLAVSVPLVFYDGGQPSNIRVSRDAPDSKTRRLDADNFHIAFVLDTQALGTVAIDLETVGRAVKLAVKTDRASAVDRFNDSLGDLRARLEHLRYKVASTDAAMVGTPSAAPQETAAPPKASNVDLQA